MIKRATIREAARGYIVEAPYPWGEQPGVLGEVVCPTLDGAIELIRRVMSGSSSVQTATVPVDGAAD